MRSALPIDAHLPALVAAVRADHAVVLVAPPGAGKSTRVPGALLDSGIKGKVLVLQPRRVAARAVARRIAQERGSAVGEEVGYRVRFEQRVGPNTRIELLTEGLLIRRLQADPFLEGVGCVILDEFHERSLHADLSLALLAEIRRDARPDLAVVVMSATLDPLPVADFLGCSVIRAEGRTFPVEVQYDARPGERPAFFRVAMAARAALSQGGDVLVFLPGVGEINRISEQLTGIAEVDVMPLHGRLPAAEQDRALLPSSRRKIVLATNLAETSVTIPGVRAVVDMGEARVPRFDAGIGLTRLMREPISQASADQRAGRAGRTAPGICRRLWSAAEHTHRPPATLPALRREDLTRAMLEIYAWGQTPTTFAFFEAPDPAVIEHACAVLERLGAIADDQITPLGRALVDLPIHPRLGAVIHAGHALGSLRDAAAAAALTSERDIYRTPPDIVAPSDLMLRLDALRRGDAGLDRRAVSEVKRVQEQLIRVARDAWGRGADQPADAETLTEALRAGFPDRVAQRRAPRSERVKLAGGGGAKLDPQSVVREAKYLIAVSLEGRARGEEHRIRIAHAIDPKALQTTPHAVTKFDTEREKVSQSIELRFMSLVIGQRKGTDPEAVSQCLAEAAAADPERAFGVSRETGAYLNRLRWLADQRPELDLPTFEELLPETPPGPIINSLCQGRRGFGELRNAPLLATIKALIPYQQQQQVDAQAPPQMTLPDGSSKSLKYTIGEPPVLAGRIQQFFGLAETPTVLRGRMPVRLHLLAPNQRPQQVTQDLASFWAQGYPAVRKELRGRYPKHPWPEDPLTATPTGRAKPRKR
ncbi:MAG: ATP-dependent helicase HrpB [Bradymonadia bacterium]|jgi:ATP-dependent helicase HrpB